MKYKLLKLKNYFISGLSRFDPHNHLLRIEIDSGQLVQNIRNIKSVAKNKKFGAVLKSNAYGHGLKEIGGFLEKIKDVELFIVDSIVEARILRLNGSKKKIMILGYIPRARIKELKRLNDIIVAVNSYLQAKELVDNVNFNLYVHIKVDTGMHRNGVYLGELIDTIDLLKTNKYIHIAGIFTHLADADSKDKSNTIAQINLWKKALDVYKSKVGKSGDFHFSATAGLEYINEAESNMIRVGVGMYGYDLTPNKILNVKPIVSFFAKIVNCKVLYSGDKIGYNLTFTADKKMRVYTIPCGYNEGVPRKLSNNGFVYIKGKKMKILGRISMNVMNVGIPYEEGFRINAPEEVDAEIFSSDPNKENSIIKVAEKLETIPYDILTGIDRGIRRVLK